MTRTSPLRVVAPSRSARGAEHLLDPVRPWTLGRADDADVVVDDALVSRRHLVLEPAAAGWTVRDVSSNGSWHAGRRIAAAGVLLPPGGTQTVHLGGPAGPVVALTPGPPPRRTRRRGLRWLVALAVLLVLLVVADRAAAAVAGHQAVRQIVQRSQGLSAEPSVSFGGFPFLTQVVTGTYSDIHVHLDDVRPPDAPRITSIDAHLRGADVPLSSVLQSALHSIPVDRVEGTVDVAFADLNAYLAGQTGGLHLSAAGGGAIRIAGKVDLDGSAVAISGSAKLAVADGALVVTPVDIAVDGGDDPLGGLLGEVASLLPPVPVPLDGLPFDLRLTSVRVSGGGIEASARASNVVLQVS